MSSTQQQKSVDLIEFNSNSADTMDVLEKPNTGVVQKMVMSETVSASLIATAVAKLTTSTVVTTTPYPCSNSVVNKSESDSMVDSPANQKLDIVEVDSEHPSTLMTSSTVTATTTIPKVADTESVAAPHDEPNSLNLTQVFAIGSLSHCLHFHSSKNCSTQLTIHISLGISYHIIPRRQKQTHTENTITSSSVHKTCVHYIITQFRSFQFQHSIFGFAFIHCDVSVLSQFWHNLKKRSEAGQVSHSTAFQFYTPTTSTKRVWLYLRFYYCVPTFLSFAFLTSPFRSLRYEFILCCCFIFFYVHRNSKYQKT